jgi:hypothetical protein
MDPATAEALLRAGVGGKATLEGTLPTITAGFLLLLGPLNAACERIPTLNSEMGSMLAMAYAMHEPKDTWLLLDAQNDKSLAQTIWEWARDIPVERVKAISKWISSEIARMNSDAESTGLGKPLA